MRTLEQKISDAGPNDQRVDPHILTEARKILQEDGLVLERQRKGVAWYYLKGTKGTELQRRLDELGILHDAISAGGFSKRLGQTLEIAIYRSFLEQDEYEFFGAFPDLDDHDDSKLYRKEEPPRSVSGRSVPGEKRLDFMVFHREGGLAGIEAKNVREWMYPHRPEVEALLAKCCYLDAVPVLIARRIAYGTFSILHTSGVIVHQVFNQRYPTSEAELAERVRDKHLLGYHDVRVGNEADARLTKFLHTDLPNVLPAARTRFERNVDLVRDYSTGVMSYESFAARVRRRSRGEPEDGFP
ncbi:MAG: hypothetical protein ACREX3_04945 [Gammaproteobacteria bacterium]